MNGTAIVHSTKTSYPMATGSSSPMNPPSNAVGGTNATHPALATSRPTPSPSATDRGLPVPDFPWSQSITYLLADYEQRLIDHAMRNSDGVKRQAATLLGISRYALERRIRRLRSLRDKAAAGHPENE